MGSLLRRLGIGLPIVQAPMAGVSSPAMAAAVSNAGALGSLAVDASSAADAQRSIAEVRALTSGPLSVNVFCHAPARRDAELERRWIARLAPELARYDAVPPPDLREIYRSFVDDDTMLRTLIAAKPTAVSFHFGVPPADRIAALRAAGVVLFGTATSLAEARLLAAAGVEVIVAQGYEAGGHRGTFDLETPDDRIGTFALVRVLVRELSLPVIAAGGIMDGAGIAAALRLGASAAQLGTAFIACDESLADAAYRAALTTDAAHHTVMTRAISGRPARCLGNRFTALGAAVPDADVPAYPVAYDLGKSLHAAAKAKGEAGYGAQWAGQGAPLSRAMPAGALVATLARELDAAHASAER
ncbi:MAG: nitronate monooxygenase [Labilithrix sp.]|nr:nitronate monooxygenase [Labilithrix sp.]MBX3214602.1 nitronate monooxygenase [Labilithrix sp.]